MTKIDDRDFAIRPQSGRRTGVIGGCCDLLGRRARETGLQVVIDVAPEPPEIVAAKRALKQTLINLVSNPIKLRTRGGRLTGRW